MSVWIETKKEMPPLDELKKTIKNFIDEKQRELLEELKML